MRISDWSSDVCSSDLLRAQRGEQAGALVELAHQLGRWQLRRIAAQATDDVGEAAQCVRRARRQLLEQADRFRGARQWQVGVLRNLGQLRQRGRADPARRRLHRAQEGRVVLGIGDQPQPRQRVLDLAAVEERGAAAEVVRHAQQLQRLLQRARLVVAAEQDAEVRSEEHTSELQSLMRISYAVLCLKKKTTTKHASTPTQQTNTQTKS